MKPSKRFSIKVSPQLWNQLGQLAKEKKSTRRELAEVILRRYFLEVAWRGLQKEGIKRTRRLGLTEVDVGVLILESHLETSLRDIKAGRFYGPFNTVKEAVASLRGELKKLRKAKPRRSDR